MRRYGGWAFAMSGMLTLGACDDDAGMTEPVVATTFEVRIENVSEVFDFAATGAFNTPVGADGPGPLFPGAAYEFAFEAGPGSRLSFATMFVQSNDFFFAPDGDGIALWDEQGMQVTGDVTGQISLWDAGTEEDGEPGLGANQAPRQAGPDTGSSDDDNTVRLASDAYDNLPDVSGVVRVTLHSDGPTSFRVRIENVSTDQTLATSDQMTQAVPLAPGVWVVHSGMDPLFTAGQPDRGEGLEALAEDGSVAGLAEGLNGRTGLTSPIAPGVFAVHRGPSVLFAAGVPDQGMGLEALAEDGFPGTLAGSLAASGTVASSGAFDVPDGGSDPAPAFPGDAYTFTVTAEPGDRLSLATMLVQSNDLFFAPAEVGLDLFPNGTPVDGDVTGMILLWDAGTEVNEAPGVGLSQAPRQAAPDVGEEEGGVVRQVNDAYRYPDVSDVIRVLVRPVG